MITLNTIKVPLYMVLLANKNPELKDIILDQDNLVSIVSNNTIVGFLNPRKDNDHWRTGAIYILLEYQNKGYGTAAIKEYFKDKPNGIALINCENIGAQQAYLKAGFKCDLHYPIKTIKDKQYTVWTLTKH